MDIKTCRTHKMLNHVKILSSPLNVHEIFTKIMVLLAFIMFFVGIFATVISFKKFFIFSSKVSIIAGLFQLLSEGYAILSMVASK